MSTLGSTEPQAGSTDATTAGADPTTPGADPSAGGADPRTGDATLTGQADPSLRPGPVDHARIEAAVREILLAVGEDPERDGLLATPARVARAYAEIFSGLSQEPSQVLGTTFDVDHDEMILVKDIEMFSVCEHHLVPFHGVAHVGYIPGLDGRVVGLSKLARLVDVFARRPQVQERLTTQIADALEEHISPRGVIVVVEAEHLCMSMRGIRRPGARTITSAVRGGLRNPATRAEAMSLMMAGRGS